MAAAELLIQSMLALEPFEEAWQAVSFRNRRLLARLAQHNQVGFPSGPPRDLSALDVWLTAVLRGTRHVYPRQKSLPGRLEIKRRRLTYRAERAMQRASASEMSEEDLNALEDRLLDRASAPSRLVNPRRRWRKSRHPWVARYLDDVARLGSSFRLTAWWVVPMITRAHLTFAQVGFHALTDGQVSIRRPFVSTLEVSVPGETDESLYYQWSPELEPHPLASVKDAMEDRLRRRLKHRELRAASGELSQEVNRARGEFTRVGYRNERLGWVTERKAWALARKLVYPELTWPELAKLVREDVGYKLEIPEEQLIRDVLQFADDLEIELRRGRD